MSLIFSFFTNINFFLNLKDKRFKLIEANIQTMKKIHRPEAEIQPSKVSKSGKKWEGYKISIYACGTRWGTHEWSYRPTQMALNDH